MNHRQALYSEKRFLNPRWGLNPQPSRLSSLYGKEFALGFFRKDLALLSLGLYENLRQIHSRTDLAPG